MTMMKKKILFLLFIGFLGACSKDDAPQRDLRNPYQNPDTGITAGSYINPVFKPVLADPSVVQNGNYYYAFGTEDDWGSDGGYHLVPVVRSTDLVNWEYVRDAFDVKPFWKSGGIWAPDVTRINGSYYMYYSYSEWGDPDPGIGVAISTLPDGPYIDEGKLFRASEIGVANSIDPFYIEDNGNKYLFWGSFQGIYAIQLSDDGTEVVGDKTFIGGNHLEASYVYKKEGFFYFFGSVGSCCDGINSSYRVVVGRSPALLGPYVDKNGNALTAGNFGEIVVEANDGPTGFVGPGHNAEIVVDSEGEEWFLYHGIPKNDPLLDNGASRRPLLLDKLIWDNGWPKVYGSQPSLGEASAPVFE